MNNSSVPSSEATAILMWKVFPPILIIVGTVGNILSIIILSRKSMRKSGASRYLICLAVSDLLVLYIGLLRQWVIYMFEIDIRDRDSVICKINLWLVYFSLDMSAWILVFVTVERAISVWKPYRVKIICNLRAFVITIVLLTVVLMIFNGHFLFGFDLVDSEADKYECGSLTVEYEQFQSRIFPWIDLFLFCLGPFFCHICGNTAIIIGLVKMARNMEQYNLENSGQRENRQSQISSMTKMLLFLNLVYLVCTLPISIYFVEDAIREPEADADRRLLYACVNLLMYFNTSTNFITYIVSGRRFRAEVFTIFGKRQIQRTSTFSLSASRSSLASSQTLASPTAPLSYRTS